MNTRGTKREKEMNEAELLTFQTQLDEKERKLRRDQEALERAKDIFNKEKTQLQKEIDKMDREPGKIKTLEDLLETERRENAERNKRLQEEQKELRNLAAALQEEIVKLKRANVTATTLPLDETRSNINELPVAPRDTYISLKEASGIISRFNGHNLSVFQFSRTCERAREMISPTSEYCLVQLIINKLSGHALQIVQDTEYYTVNSLLNTLKDTFAPRKTINQYKGELANMYQFPRESVLDYVGRIKEIKTAILDGERQTKGIISENTAEEIEASVLESFVTGLAPAIKTNLKIERYADLRDAVTKSIRISKQLEVENSRYKNRNENYNRNSMEERRKTYDNKYTNNRYDNSSSSKDNSDISYNHNNRGSKLNPQANTFQPRNNPPWQQNTTQVSCTYCKRAGHTREECRTLMYRREKPQNIQQPSTSTQHPRNVNFFQIPTEPPQPPELQRSDWENKAEK